MVRSGGKEEVVVWIRGGCWGGEGEVGRRRREGFTVDDEDDGFGLRPVLRLGNVGWDTADCFDVPGGFALVDAAAEAAGAHSDTLRF